MKRLGLALAVVAFGALPARADQDSFPMDFATCLGAIAQAATQLHMPLVFSVNTPDRKAFAIATTGGQLIMVCDRVAGTLTVIAPPGQSVRPYVNGGGG
jgi:hypothetical protein